jgi:hypothetical protein
MLYDPKVHEPLIDRPWNAAGIEAEIRAIVRDTEAARTDDWWPVHPLDALEDDPDVFHGVYLGAAGVLGALEEIDGPRPELADRLLESFHARPDFAEQRTSLFLGEAGIALYAVRHRPELVDRLYELAVVPEDETFELLWGSPGGLLVADAMLTATGEPRWAARWDELADHLMAARQENGFWTQRLHGNTCEHLGPAHGMAGVVLALARRRPIDATPALAAHAVREGAHANWPAALDEGLVHHSGTIRTQWCHGAPGMVTSFASLPADDRLDELLIAGGELTWAAGPLRKGAGLCHGTAGNGFALLKLFTRTGDELWLDRARRFAVHAAAQVAEARRRDGRGRHTLWTGDLGTAIYLQQCLAETSNMPTIG